MGYEATLRLRPTGVTELNRALSRVTALATAIERINRKAVVLRVNRRGLDQLESARRSIQDLRRTAGQIDLRLSTANAEKKLEAFRKKAKAPIEATLATARGASAGAGSVAAGLPTRGAAAGVAGMIPALGKLAAMYLTVDTAVRQTGQAISKSLDFAAQQQRLKSATSSVAQFQQAQEIAANAANKFNLSQLEATRGIAQISSRLLPLGFNLREVEEIYNGFNTAAIISGTTAAESRGAFLQLSQALGSGVLRGQEFNSIAEQAPRLLKSIADEMDKPVGALKELAAEGAITSDVLVAALKRASTDGADQLAEALDNPQQAAKLAAAAYEDLQVALANLVQPQLVAFLEDIAGVLKRTNEALKEGEKRFENVKYAADKLTQSGLLGWTRDLVEAFGILNQKMGQFQILGVKMAEFFNTVLYESIKTALGPLGQFISLAGKVNEYTSGLPEKVTTPQDRPKNAKPEEDPLAERLGLPGQDGSGATSGANAARSAAASLNDAERLASRQRDLEDRAFDRKRDSENALQDLKIKHANDLYAHEERLRQRRDENVALGLSGAARSTMETLMGAGADIRGVNASGRDDQNDLAEMRRQLADLQADRQRIQAAPATARFRSAGGGGGAGGYYEVDGIGPTSTGSHLDVKRADYAYFDRAALDQYVKVNGNPLSSGVTIPGGRFGAPRSYGPHAGWDYAFAAGSRTTLHNGAQWVGSTPTKHGDKATFSVPGMGSFNLLHGRSKISGGGGATGQAVRDDRMGQLDKAGRLAENQDDIRATTEQLRELEEQQRRVNEVRDEERQILRDRIGLELTERYRAEAEELRNTGAAQQLVNRLQMEGVEPEIIQAEERNLAVQMETTEVLKTLAAGYQAAGLSMEEYIKNAREIIELRDANASARLKVAGEAVVNREQQEELDYVRDQYAQIGQTIGGELMGAMDALVGRTEDWQDVLSNIARNLGDRLMQTALGLLAGNDGVGVFSFLGFGGGRATGGPVLGNTPYLVGEDGPELFVPGVSGKVVSSDQTVPYLDSQNREGGEAEDIRQAEALGIPYMQLSGEGSGGRSGASSRSAAGGRRGPALAIPFLKDSSSSAERIEEISSAVERSAPVEIKVETQVINGVEYMTREQGEAMAAAAAQQGTRATFAALQNSVTTRRRVGL